MELLEKVHSYFCDSIADNDIHPDYWEDTLQLLLHLWFLYLYLDV